MTTERLCDACGEERLVPFAEKFKITVAMHNHANLKDPNEFATPESFATALAQSKQFAINLDIGHFVAANFDPIDYIQKNHKRITNLHIKDRKKDQGDNVPWGQGDTPIKDRNSSLKPGIRNTDTEPRNGINRGGVLLFSIRVRSANADLFAKRRQQESPPGRAYRHPWLRQPGSCARAEPERQRL